MCALVRHGLDDGLRAEEPSEAAGDRQRRCVCVFMISCVHVYSSTQGIFLYIEGEVQTKMNILPVLFSSPRNTALFLCNTKAGILKSVQVGVFHAMPMNGDWRCQASKGLSMTIKYYNQWLVHSYKFLKSYCSIARETDLHLSPCWCRNFS